MISSPASNLAAGGFVNAFGHRCYRINQVEGLPPFLVSLVSATDLWMFVASNGALTAGRADADGALFPYQTVDRIYDSAGAIGPMTILGVMTPAGEEIWEPFAPHTTRHHRVTRNLYKSIEGDRIWFEEVHPALGLAFRYGWASADRLGFVRRCELVNLSTQPRPVRVLDGLRNLLPAGIPQRLQAASSNLADAYKTAALLPDAPLAVFALAAAVVDRPSPVESLRASAVWSGGLPGATVLLSDRQVGAFLAGGDPAPEPRCRGLRCAYYLVDRVELAAGESRRWFMVADTGLGPAEIEARRQSLTAGTAETELTAAVNEATLQLRKLVAAADGLQAGGDETVTVHHFANVLFNVLRGGTFPEGYLWRRDDFIAHVAHHNRAAARRHDAALRQLPPTLARADLLARVATWGDPDLARLAGEYLPLAFSRRHGDPSRPWNRFSIHLHDEHGRRRLAYEGNWRDIFQNWEALGRSFPEYFDGFIAKFLNASTADGFNPYRISQGGIDWEVPDPEDPWSSIGYWGDHQVVYLLKLLEWSARHHPGALTASLRTPQFIYANVPYRLADYGALRRNPRATIGFDAVLHRNILARVPEIGADARLLADPAGRVLHANLTEKLLVLVLGRLVHFIPGGGIWMNTQRPEWNDANNALVGYGVSLVTLCYLRRLLAHVRTELLPTLGAEPVPVAGAVVELAQAVESTLAAAAPRLAEPEFGPANRRALVDALARAGERYRACVYAAGPGPAVALDPARCRRLCEWALAFIDHTIRANRRADGLYHAYNQLAFTENPAGIELRRLPLMLEGQVAVLSSGLLTPSEAVGLLEALRASDLYRADQSSYLLYPDRELPGFLERNRIDPATWAACPLFAAMLAAGDRRLVLQDPAGRFRFNPRLVDDAALERALAELAADPRWATAVTADAEQVRAAYESVFRHRAFTGRSGSMFGFEGLGCIYWHMVAKLLLAAQENLLAAQAGGAPETSRLAELYYAVRAGLGFNKTPAAYGAFPTDPYSHTPGHSGAQQPGMTGQVKEEILTRWGELGVVVEQGQLHFNPTFLRSGEFANAAGKYACFTAAGREIELDLPRQTLAFTCCGTPVIYRRNAGPAQLHVHGRDGLVRVCAGRVLPAPESRAVFARDGSIVLIEIDLGGDYAPRP